MPASCPTRAGHATRLLNGLFVAHPDRPGIQRFSTTGQNGDIRKDERFGLLALTFAIRLRLVAYAHAIQLIRPDGRALTE